METLADVVEFYNRGGGDGPNKSPLLRPLGLVDQEMTDLTAFLERLASEDMPVITKPDLPVYQPRALGAN